MSGLGGDRALYGTPLERARFVAGLGFKASPRQMMLALAITVVGAGASLVYPLAFRVLIDGIVESRSGDVLRGAVVVGAFYGLMWAAGILLAVEGVSLVDRVGFHLSARFATLVSSTPGIGQFERQDYLRELDLVSENRRLLAGGPRQGLLLLQVALRSLGIVVVLATIDGRLAALMLAAAPAVIATWAAANWQERADEESVCDIRLANDLFGFSVSAAAAKELRIFGLSRELDRRHSAAAGRVVATSTRVAGRVVGVGVGGWGLYGAGFAAALLLLVDLVKAGEASMGDLLLAVTLTRQVQQQISRASGIFGQVVAIVRIAGRFLWLEEFATSRSGAVPGTPQPAPDRLDRGIAVEGVTFSYGDGPPALQGVDLVLPAGSTVAIVGENGAGKTTLVKLLSGMYQPSAGRILFDDVDVADMAHEDLRSRIAAAFQDFVPFELLARHAVGVGQLRQLNDTDAVVAALKRAGAVGLPTELDDGLDTPLGKSFPNGAELSGGQWQKLALSRSMMRRTPLLLILDEPTASLDPATEHALFERYATEAARTAAETGTVTLLVSHRFSTVRAADLIVVLNGGRVVEVGDHRSLLASCGLYAELYRLQARSYA